MKSVVCDNEEGGLTNTSKAVSAAQLTDSNKIAEGSDYVLQLANAPSETLIYRRLHKGILVGFFLFLAILLSGVGYVGYLALNPDAAGKIAWPFQRTSIPDPPIAPDNPALAKVDPVKFIDVPVQEAREMNAAVPFSTAPNPAAKPFIITAALIDTTRAVDCLASAAWYEAGDDVIGQAAVIQVVLNRMRHPAFPKSVCAVVYQGSERRTGCQFSFTCDGSLKRIPSVAAWTRARGAAVAALNGLTFPKVGYATHYHTDWVVPYWSAKVDKITAVGTHLFFRWFGNAGKPSAFLSKYAGSEPVIPKLAFLSAAHRGSDEDASAEIAIEPGADGTNIIIDSAPSLPKKETATTISAGILRGNAVVDVDTQRNQFILDLASQGQSGSFAVVALSLCKSRDMACRVAGHAPDGLGKKKAYDFYFYRDAGRGVETIYWNCDIYPRSNQQQCMKDDFRPHL